MTHVYLGLNLSNRTHRVSCCYVIYGVPQESISGPLLFLIFINDLPLYIQSTFISVDLYADDTYFYYSNYDKLVLERNLHASLDCLQRWCRENGMVLNTDKTKVMLIKSRQNNTETSLYKSDPRFSPNTRKVKMWEIWGRNQNDEIGQFSIFLHKIICCGCVLESPHRGDSKTHPKHDFMENL